MAKRVPRQRHRWRAAQQLLLQVAIGGEATADQPHQPGQHPDLAVALHVHDAAGLQTAFGQQALADFLCRGTHEKADHARIAAEAGRAPARSAQAVEQCFDPAIQLILDAQRQDTCLDRVKPNGLRQTVHPACGGCLIVTIIGQQRRTQHGRDTGPESGGKGAAARAEAGVIRQVGVANTQFGGVCTEPVHKCARFRHATIDCGMHGQCVAKCLCGIASAIGGTSPTASASSAGHCGLRFGCMEG